MYKYAKYLSQNKLPHIVKIMVVAILSAVLGVLMSTNLKMGLALISLGVFLVMLEYFGIRIVIYIMALGWWLPIDLPLSFLGNYVFDLTLPEVIAYGGLLLLLFSGFTKKMLGRKSKLLDPIWVFLLLLLLGGLIALGNIKTDIGYAMFRRSTFFFISVMVVCRCILTDRRKIYCSLKLLLISNCLFILFILIAPNFQGVFFEKALSYLDTSRLGGVYIIPRIGNFYFGPNNIGLITGMGTIIALTFVLFEPGHKKHLIAIAALMLNVLALALTGSRGSLISTLIATIPIIWYFLWTKKKTKVIFYAIALIISAIILLPNFLTPEVVERMQSITSIINDPYGSGQVRIYLLEKGIDLFWRNPFGIGYGTFVTLTDNFILWEQNLLLNTALGAGFLGLIGLLGFFFLLFGRGISRIIFEPMKTKYIDLALLSASLAFFINSLVTDTNAETGVYFAWLVLGITLSSISLPKLTAKSTNRNFN